MNAALLALALAYVFLLFLLLLAVLKSETGPGYKLALAALCAGFYLWHFDALKAYLGWPSGGDLPPRFELVSSFTVEPDLQRDRPGAIYLWITDLDGESTVPRAYRLPYHKQLHRQLGDTLEQQQQGERFVGRPVPGGAGRRAGIEFEAVQRDSGPPKPALGQ